MSGLVAGLAAGAIMHYGANLVEMLCALASHYGAHPVTGIGWFVHMILSVVFTLGFAGIVSSRPVRRRVDDFVDFLVAGLAFGAFLGIVAAGLFFPTAMQTAGFSALPEPFLSAPGVLDGLVAAAIFAIGYLTYGVTLAATFATINPVTPTGVSNGAVVPE